MLSLDFINNEYEDTKTPAQRVCETIAIDILTGIIPDGKQLVEQQLCDRHHISRTPAREVLKDLQALGLIEIIPNRGAFVTAIGHRDVDDLYYMKSLLYPQCIRWAIERITDEEFAMLEDAFSFMRFYAPTEDIEKIQRIIHGFNAIIYNASHNKELETTLLRYDFLIKYANRGVRYPLDFMPSVLDEHRAIFEAFQQRNPEMGEEAAQIHAYKSMMRRK